MYSNKEKNLDSRSSGARLSLPQIPFLLLHQIQVSKSLSMFFHQILSTLMNLYYVASILNVSVWVVLISIAGE